MSIIDIAEIIPKITTRGNEIVSDIDNKPIMVTYLRKRGKPTAYKLNRYIHKKEKPLIHTKRVKENSNGIVNIRINSTVLKELFYYWAHILPSLLQ